MAELWNTERVRAERGYSSVRAASRALHRLGVEAVSREPGRSGQNLYDSETIIAAFAGMPGRGRRADVDHDEKLTKG